MSNLSKIKPKLRTEGRVSGNFGRNKVQGKSQFLDLSSVTLQKDELKIPRPDEVYERLRIAYTQTQDPKLKAFLADTLKKREATAIRPKANVEPTPSEFWEEVKRVR